MAKPQQAEADSSVHATLERLATQTSKVVPAPGLNDWIWQRVEREPKQHWLRVSKNTGRLALLVGTLAAAASVALAFHSQVELDEELTASVALGDVDDGLP